MPGPFPSRFAARPGKGSWKDPQKIGSGIKTREGVYVFVANIRASLITFLATFNDVAF